MNLLNAELKKEQILKWKEQGDICYTNGEYERACIFYENSISSNPTEILLKLLICYGFIGEQNKFDSLYHDIFNHIHDLFIYIPENFTDCFLYLFFTKQYKQAFLISNFWKLKDFDLLISIKDKIMLSAEFIGEFGKALEQVKDIQKSSQNFFKDDINKLALYYEDLDYISKQKVKCPNLPIIFKNINKGEDPIKLIEFYTFSEFERQKAFLYTIRKFRKESKWNEASYLMNYYLEEIKHQSVNIKVKL